MAEHGGRAYPDLAAVLADDAVETVVNLTVPQAHAEVAARRSRRRHIEKPLAAPPRRRGPPGRACASTASASQRSSTLLGEAQQTLWKHVREGAVGRVRAVYAEANWDRIERWHPDPRSLYAVGPLVDVGVYPLTILTAMFGPVRKRPGRDDARGGRALLDGTPSRRGRPTSSSRCSSTSRRWSRA